MACCYRANIPTKLQFWTSCFHRTSAPTPIHIQRRTLSSAKVSSVKSWFWSETSTPGAPVELVWLLTFWHRVALGKSFNRRFISDPLEGNPLLPPQEPRITANVQMRRGVFTTGRSFASRDPVGQEQSSCRSIPHKQQILTRTCSYPFTKCLRVELVSNPGVTAWSVITDRLS